MGGGEEAIEGMSDGTSPPATDAMSGGTVSVALVQLATWHRRRVILSFALSDAELARAAYL